MLWSAPSPDPASPSWPERLRTAALAGHRGASHDLDAVCALFDAAERVSQRYGGVVGIPSFLVHLAEHRLPAESVSDRAGSALPAVELLTAHASRGREWDTVIVCGVQEGTWPSARARSSVLDVDALDLVLGGHDASLTATPAHRRGAVAAAMAEERRLLALALTRARHRVHVAAVRSADDRGDQPSRFLDDIAAGIATGPVHVPGRPARAGTLDGLIAELRSAAEDPATAPAVREDAVSLLARLAREGAVVPGADPGRWWGLLDPSPGTGPVRPEAEPVALSGSALDGLQGCPRAWFLDREAHAEVGRGHAMAFGSVVHALAESVVRGLLPADPAVLESYADQVWSELAFEAPWQEVAERTALRDALRRFCAYHRASQRTVAAVEHPFSVDIPMRVDIPIGDHADDHVATDTVRLRGIIDRIELTVDGDVVLVDLKTMRRPPSGPQVREHVQLATYQAAVLHDALEDVVGPGAKPGGAELVQLRVDADAGSALPRVQEQPALESVQDHWLGDLLADAVRRIRLESFPAVPGADCRRCAFRRSCPAVPEGAEVGA
ncbi:MAG: PD-(D/E)XK nuclease family protein [bacterium]